MTTPFKLLKLLNGTVSMLAGFLLLTAAAFAEEAPTSTSLPVETSLTTTVWSHSYEASEPFNLLSFTGAEGWTGEMELRFEHDGVWGLWIPLEPDIHSRFANEYEAVVTDLTTRFEVQLSTSSAALPFQWAGSFELVNGGESATSVLLEKESSENVSIVSRSEWGADETLRFIDPESFVDYPINDAELEENLKIVNVEYTDEAGNTLNWPLQYVSSITRLTVHHTTTDLKYLKDAASAVRSIYYFHTVVRGWGDLGYHYLIAPDGTIYKGRYGDDTVVAAHTSGYNVGNLGVVLIGPYHREPVEGAALDSLLKLLLAKAEEHDIDLDDESPYKGESLANLIGHRDVGTTLCPGAYLYEHLEELRSFLGAQQDLSVSSTYAVDASLLTLTPQQAKKIELPLENTGASDWSTETYFSVEALLDADFLTRYPRETLSLTQAVPAGGSTTLEWTLRSTWTPGLTALKITPHWNGTEEGEPFLLPIFVQEPFINFEVLDLNYDQVAALGETVHVTAQLKNTGNVTWNNPLMSESAVLIGKVDAAQVGLDELYVSTETLVAITAAVKPDETVTVEWDVLVDEALLSGQLFFHAEMPEVESSVSSRLQHLTVWTNPEDEEISVIDKGSARVFKAGQVVGGWIQFTNHTDNTLDLTGTEDLVWETSVHSAGSELAVEVESFFAHKTLAPGMSTRVYFRLIAPEEAGEYEINWIPMQGGFTLWTAPLIYDFAVEN